MCTKLTFVFYKTVQTKDHYIYFNNIYFLNGTDFCYFSNMFSNSMLYIKSNLYQKNETVQTKYKLLQRWLLVLIKNLY